MCEYVYKWFSWVYVGWDGWVGVGAHSPHFFHTPHQNLIMKGRGGPFHPIKFALRKALLSVLNSFLFTLTHYAHNLLITWTSCMRYFVSGTGILRCAESSVSWDLCVAFYQATAPGMGAAGDDTCMCACVLDRCCGVFWPLGERNGRKKQF